ncbi:hypothetical protein K437DRAFT_90652 [Tilletiaria anomala UBC 951]|uniref:Uncharacterized protein n=1 Tax=Tilletiaria anomala (strain ATCC 24038 / CBS 436.72 / UBC 951) TaxID=1037660 RepID=A0A066WA83_TILAU|nr:uncharacterized protein K437DRAFT_90652 [Tilletiaria anomala UBC 951]KDN47989.1 hypothetical protein K437DRAFT_90652 [Tilletiaria anomala UBC 951]
MPPTHRPKRSPVFSSCMFPADVVPWSVASCFTSEAFCLNRGAQCGRPQNYYYRTLPAAAAGRHAICAAYILRTLVRWTAFKTSRDDRGRRMAGTPDGDVVGCGSVTLIYLYAPLRLSYVMIFNLIDGDVHSAASQQIALVPNRTGSIIRSFTGPASYA